MNLSQRLLSWVQNEEMVDHRLTQHGLDCNAAVNAIEVLRELVHYADYASTDEFKRLAVRRAMTVLDQAARGWVK